MTDDFDEAVNELINTGFTIDESKALASQMQYFSEITPICTSSVTNSIRWALSVIENFNIGSCLNAIYKSNKCFIKKDRDAIRVRNRKEKFKKL